MRHLPRHFSRLKRLLLRRGRTHADSEDLIQEAFLRMQEYCERGGEVQRPEGFLVRTVLRLAANATRDAHHDMYCDQAIENFTDILDTRPMPEEVMAAEECLERMRDALDAVNHRTREIFFMQRLDGLSYAQIARQMGISVSAVEKHMASALAILSDINELP